MGKLALRLVVSVASIPSCRTMASTSSHLHSIAQKAAVAQLRSTSSKLTNLLDIAKCCGWARASGSSMIFLPECCGFMGESGEDSIKQSEPPVETDTAKNSPSVTLALKNMVASPSSCVDTEVSDSDADRVSLLDGMKTIARESNMWISCGGLHVAGAPPAITDDKTSPRNYNMHIVLDNNGELKAVYKKIHLFDVSIPGKVDLRESARTAPGNKLVVCDSPLGRYANGTVERIYDGENSLTTRTFFRFIGQVVLDCQRATTFDFQKCTWSL